MDRTLTVTQGGKPGEVTLEEALQHRTYQDAIKGGNRASQREVLKMMPSVRNGLPCQIDTRRCMSHVAAVRRRVWGTILPPSAGRPANLTARELLLFARSER
jgi:hypothetical protein